MTAPQSPGTRAPDWPYEQVVFSGGGLRCFWQGGFVEEITADRRLRPDRVTGVSGGALSAACFLGGRDRDLLRAMARAFSHQDGNSPLHTQEGDGLTPHQRIYRKVVEEVLDEAAQARIADGPAFQILLGHPPKVIPPRLGGTLAAFVYEAELHLRSAPRFGWTGLAGVDSSLIDARAAARQRQLADLVIAAATIPPIFDLPTWEGRAVIDGGMTSQVPLPDPNHGETLILLTRHYKTLPHGPGCTFVEPSEEAPADKIDFSDPEKIERTWALGQRDGRAWLGTSGAREGA
ncbi:patatin-like phospholipase family protein [Mesobaculum littorinae]|uniref:Patatin-like phospholipase family protein n=1 Tax=Mesobaculum littorinae TaxID=2486419 RepID=A0A438AGP3_9RHOB|nr:patatin-like phospholipase family protein [Mesobaculum littorinae]RVV97795.1 patatin-like phospholipase family protein [Mesobaculum littorinae]